MKLIKLIARFLCPPKCLICDEVFDIDSMRLFCNECLYYFNFNVIAFYQENFSTYVDKIYAHFEYESRYTKSLIRHLKYVSSDEAHDFIGSLAVNSLKDKGILEKTDIVTFSPRRKSQITRYGFDQSEEIAKAIGEKSGIPVNACLKRVGFSVAQKKLGAANRVKNISGKFECVENLKGKRILLIDDVVTTGSTVNECAKMLKSKGAKAVYVWAIAH